MSDKERYSSMVTERKKASSEDKVLAKKILQGHIRKEMFGHNWQKVNLNDVVAKFAPGSIPISFNGKIEWHNPGSSIKVVADIGGGYCRLEKYPKTTTHTQYLDINGKDAFNYTTPDGKTKGRTHEEYLQRTHFLIKKKGEL